jgi:hypothetical protein
MARVDTHQLIQDLLESGLPQKSSEILGKAFLNSSNNNEYYVTKEQFTHLEKEQSDIKTSLAVITQTMATKTDISEVKSDILKWMIPLFLTVLISNIAILIALFK